MLFARWATHTLTGGDGEGLMIKMKRVDLVNCDALSQKQNLHVRPERDPGIGDEYCREVGAAPGVTSARHPRYRFRTSRSPARDFVVTDGSQRKEEASFFSRPQRRIRRPARRGLDFCRPMRRRQAGRLRCSARDHAAPARRGQCAPKNSSANRMARVR